MTLFFLHAPRTGGTALRLAYERQLGPERVLKYFTRDGPETSPAARKIMHPTEPQSMPEKLQRLSNYIVENDVGLFVSHLSAVQLECFNPTRAFMIVRHPVDRLISEYRYVRDRRHSDLSFDRFLALPGVHNRQTRLLMGTKLEDLGVVGVFDQYDDFIRRLNGTYKLTLAVEKCNSNRLRARRFLLYQNSKNVKTILDQNEQDLALFERAQALVNVAV